MLADLGIVDLHHCGGQIDIGAVERDRLSYSHARAGQEAEESLVGRASQGRSQGSGSLH